MENAIKSKVDVEKINEIGTGNDVNMLITRAIDKAVPVETMEKLLAMRRELKQEYAEEEFNRAMSEFQSECPTIQKKKAGGQTRSGKVAYMYAPIESIVEQVKDIIRKCGFSYRIQTLMTEGKVKVICTVKHIAGHSESTDIELPLTTKTEIMSAPQVVAATVTFGKRYSFCNAFGIMTGDEDTDASNSNGEAKDTIKTPKAKVVEEADILFGEGDSELYTSMRAKIVEYAKAVGKTYEEERERLCKAHRVELLKNLDPMLQQGVIANLNNKIKALGK